VTLRQAPGVVAAVTALLLTSCGGGDLRTGGSASPTAEASDPTSSSGAETSAAPEPTESSASSPDVPLPDGATLRTAEGVSITVPRGFDGDEEGRPDQPRISVRESDRSQITLSTRQQVGAPDFELFKEIALESTPSALRLTAQPDRELLGQPAYHFSGRLDQYQQTDQFGVVTPDGVVVSLEFWTLTTYTPAERAEIIEPVLASISLG